MNVTSILSAEHAWIWHYAHALTWGSELLRGGERPPREFFHGVLEFGQEFVLDYHGTREQLLAAVLRRREGAGALGVALDQGHAGRATIQHRLNALSWRVALLDDWRAVDRVATAEILDELAVALVDQTTMAESTVFLSARRLLNERDNAALLRRFHRQDLLIGSEALFDLHELALYLYDLAPRPSLAPVAAEGPALAAEAG